MALAAVWRDDKGPHIVGVSRYYAEPETRRAEFAVVVKDGWQGRGLGWRLMQRLIGVARERGVRRLVGQVLRENEGMLGLAKDLGFVARPTAEDGVIEVELDLGDGGIAP
jgi:acetyltransferase